MTPELGLPGKTATALSLTAIGGFVDAVGYIALFQIFTANMSGNSVHIGMYLGQHSFMELLRPFSAVLSYVVGLALTRIAVEIAAREGMKRIASVSFAVEAALLALFAHAQPAMHLGQIVDQHSAQYFAMVAWLSFAMGVQTATLTQVGALTVSTTFVTGTLTRLTESLTRVLFWVWDQARESGVSHVVGSIFRQPDVRDTAILGSIWLCYVLGAALGTLLKSAWGLAALYVPVAVLALFIVIDQLHPLAVQEERRQTKAG